DALDAALIAGLAGAATGRVATEAVGAVIVHALVVGAGAAAGVAVGLLRHARAARHRVVAKGGALTVGVAVAGRAGVHVAERALAIGEERAGVAVDAGVAVRAAAVDVRLVAVERVVGARVHAGVDVGVADLV